MMKKYFTVRGPVEAVLQRNGTVNSVGRAGKGELLQAYIPYDCDLFTVYVTVNPEERYIQVEAKVHVSASCSQCLDEVEELLWQVETEEDFARYRLYEESCCLDATCHVPLLGRTIEEDLFSELLETILNTTGELAGCVDNVPVLGVNGALSRSRWKDLASTHALPAAQESFDGTDA